MLKVTKQINGNTVLVTLEGVIDETCDFASFMPQVPGGATLEVNVKGISRINSLGVDSWIKYFSRFQQYKLPLRFVECSPAVVTNFSHIVNFHCGAEIVSVYLPYSCGECNKGFLHLMKTEEVRPLVESDTLPEFPCRKCGKGTLFFDDVPEEYFRFLKRKPTK